MDIGQTHSLLSAEFSVAFMWRLAHIGITEKELADENTKLASMKLSIDIHVAVSKKKVKGLVKDKILDRRQRWWGGTTKEAVITGNRELM